VDAGPANPVSLEWRKGRSLTISSQAESPDRRSLVQDNADVEPGERWAYRARQVDELVEVRVLRLGTQKPARVLVRFVDDAFEGREEWVPPARLKVPWQTLSRSVSGSKPGILCAMQESRTTIPACKRPSRYSSCSSTMRTPRSGIGRLVRSGFVIPVLWPPGSALTLARSRITRWRSPTARP
jgi:hypothetical protein